MQASIVIPARNAYGHLVYTLQSLNFQYADFADFEVIVVDNGSTDRTAQLLCSFCANYPLRVVRLTRAHSPGYVLNQGVKAASGEIVIFTAADMIVPREYVSTHILAHRNEAKLVLAGGLCKRVYSVFYPAFSLRQKRECREWLAQYPQIKRPHTTKSIVAMLDEKQIASGQLAEIGLPCRLAVETEELLKRYGPRLTGYRTPWTAFQTSHVSLNRNVFAEVGYFREKAASLFTVERDMGIRLHRAGFSFHLADKLVTVCQEHPDLMGARRDLHRRGSARFGPVDPGADVAPPLFGKKSMRRRNEAISTFNKLPADEQWRALYRLFVRMAGVYRQRMASGNLVELRNLQRSRRK